MDYGLMYDALYAWFGVEAVLTLPGTDGQEIPLTAIDFTSGVSTSGMEDRRRGFSSEVHSVEPAAAVMASDIAAIDRAELRDASLLINGKTWKVRNHAPRPSPTGEADGEVLLFLTESA